MTRLDHVSASQVTKFRRCNRKWGWEYLKGFRGPSTDKMRQGIAIHHALEHYVNTGKILDEVFMSVKTGRRAQHGEKWLTARFVHAAIPLLPDHTTLTAEHRIRMPTLGGDGPPWVGYIDAHNGISVFDYKTTGNINYAKTPEDLLTDPQAVAYTRAVFQADDEIETVDATWVYLETRNKIKVRTKVVTATFTRAECEEQWDKCGETVTEMMEAAEEEDMLNLDGNYDACNDFFKPCFQTTRCGRDSVQLEGGKNMTSLLSQLQDSVKKPGATPSKPQAVLPPDAAPRETTAEEQAASDESKGKPKAKKKKPAKKKATVGEPCLYINSLPVKGDKDYVLFDDWIQPVVDRMNGYVSDEFKLDDYRLLDFSKEKALFAKAVQDQLKADKPHSMVIVSSGMYARDAMQVLTCYYKNVVRNLMG